MREIPIYCDFSLATCGPALKPHPDKEAIDANLDDARQLKDNHYL